MIASCQFPQFGIPDEVFETQNEQIQKRIDNNEEQHIPVICGRPQYAIVDEDIVEIEEHPDFERILQTSNNRHYGIGEKLGQGGFGQVLEVYSYDDRQYYAMKVLRNATAQDKNNVLKEINSINIMCDVLMYADNIVRYIETFENGDELCMVMEKLDCDLEHVMQEANGPLPLDIVKRVGRQLLAAIADIHSAGYVHGDLKHQNLMVSAVDGDDWILKVIDLGLMTTASELVRRLGAQYGTAEYWAPEMVIGLPLCNKLDIWAAGVILFELYTGKRIYNTKSKNSMFSALTKIAGFPAAMQRGVYYEKMFHNEKSADGKYHWKYPELSEGEHSWYQHEGFKELRKFGANGSTEEPQFERADFLFQDLMYGMLFPTPTYRLTARQALSHDFFRDE